MQATSTIIKERYTMESTDHKYKICTKCIMDTSDVDISFDKDGICSHCHRYIELFSSRIYSGTEATRMLEKVTSAIRKSGKGKEYDCIIGVSGGVDSSYVAYLVKELGLKPLAIHFDNGWNSELAVSNIEKVLKKLDIDLFTYVIDWEEFRDLQLSFLKASTPDGEIPTDHAINALLFNEASKRGIKYILNGMNFATESAAVPSWAYGHSDWKYINGVHEIFGKIKLKGYPHYSLLQLFYYTFIKRIKVVSILNYIDYNKDQVMDMLQNEFGWVYYGGKHYESVYTRFYQSYFLPQKFNIDKRRVHLSDLIHADQLSRREALSLMAKPVADPEVMKQDRQFAIKKLEMTEKEFQQVMDAPVKSFRDYPNNYNAVVKLKLLVNWLRRKNIYSK